MPNWCSNRVTITGTEDKVNEVRNAVKNLVTAFSFDAILPMPIELRLVSSPTRIVTEEERIEYIIQHADDPFLSCSLPITQEMCDDYNKRYGASNWYDWANDNWGTKWDCSDVSVSDYELEYVQYTFETPWGPPEGIYQVLLKWYPDVRIEWFFDEPGMERAGYLKKTYSPSYINKTECHGGE